MNGQNHDKLDEREGNNKLTVNKAIKEANKKEQTVGRAERLTGKNEQNDIRVVKPEGPTQEEIYGRLCERTDKRTNRSTNGQ